jgi:ABC-type phosphate transport system ATPase subunit
LIKKYFNLPISYGCLKINNFIKKLLQFLKKENIIQIKFGFFLITMVILLLSNNIKKFGQWITLIHKPISLIFKHSNIFHTTHVEPINFLTKINQLSEINNLKKLTSIFYSRVCLPNRLPPELESHLSIFYSYKIVSMMHTNY